MNKIRADYLFATPSALSGIARFLDMAGHYDAYNVSANDAEADGKATYLDWASVGNNLRSTIEKALAEHRELQLRR
jgi:hypothetical protein